MDKRITLHNTNISFTPSFLGGGWETSLAPKFEKKLLTSQHNIRFSVYEICEMLLKRIPLGRNGFLGKTVIAFFL